MSDEYWHTTRPSVTNSITKQERPTSTKNTAKPKSSKSTFASQAAAPSASSGNMDLTTSRGCADQVDGDAPFSLSCEELASVITMPRGNRKAKGGIVFLVHGTGSTGEETWGAGPYNTILSDKG